MAAEEERWEEAVALGERFLRAAAGRRSAARRGRRCAGGPAQPGGKHARPRRRRACGWGSCWRRAALVLVGLLALARRLRGRSVASALARLPDLYPEVALVIAEIRHDVLKHRASALGMLGAADAPRAGDGARAARAERPPRRRRRPRTSGCAARPPPPACPCARWRASRCSDRCTRALARAEALLARQRGRRRGPRAASRSIASCASGTAPRWPACWRWRRAPASIRRRWRPGCARWRIQRAGAGGDSGPAPAGPGCGAADHCRGAAHHRRQPGAQRGRRGARLRRSPRAACAWRKAGRGGPAPGHVPGRRLGAHRSCRWKRSSGATASAAWASCAIWCAAGVVTWWCDASRRRSRRRSAPLFLSHANQRQRLVYRYRVREAHRMTESPSPGPDHVKDHVRRRRGLPCCKTIC